MTNLVLVDKKLRGTRIITSHGAQYGDNLHVAEVVPTEFSQLSAFYPILLSGEGDSRGYKLVSIFGFEAGENLFLENDSWDAGYIPLTFRRQPFSLRSQKLKEEDGTTSNVPILAIDLDSPRVSTEAGEPMFTEDGEVTEWFKGMNQLIAHVLQSSNLGGEFVRKLDVMELIKPLELGVRLADGTTRRLDGLHTIDDTRLRELPDKNVLELHQLGYLDYIYSMRASMAQLGSLARRKNTRIKAS